MKPKKKAKNSWKMWAIVATCSDGWRGPIDLACNKADAWAMKRNVASFGFKRPAIKKVRVTEI